MRRSNAAGLASEENVWEQCENVCHFPRSGQQRGCLHCRAPGSCGRPQPQSGCLPAPAATATSQIASLDRWEHAGYNQDEIVYTVFITNHEPNILRCRTEIHGFYFNNGQKGEISDVQVSTVFPDKQVQAGIWSGLDEAAGATYKVSCRAL